MAAKALHVLPIENSTGKTNTSKCMITSDKTCMIMVSSLKPQKESFLGSKRWAEHKWTVNRIGKLSNVNFQF